MASIEALRFGAFQLRVKTGCYRRPFGPHSAARWWRSRRAIQLHGTSPFLYPRVSALTIVKDVGKVIGRFMSGNKDL